MSMEKKEGRLVGIIGKSFGLNGELYIRLFTDYPNSIDEGVFLYIEPDLKTKIQVKKKRIVKKKGSKRYVLEFHGYDSIEKSSRLTGKNLYRDPEESPKLRDDEFYLDELKGSEVRLFNDNKLLGTVTDIMQNTGNDILVLDDRSGQEQLIPFVKDYIYKIDNIKKEIILKKIPEYY